MNKTEVFESYEDFLAREDKSVNGVSTHATKIYPNYAEMNETNTGCWNCFNCTNCIDCISCDYCTDCTNCKSCWHCSGATNLDLFRGQIKNRG